MAVRVGQGPGSGSLTDAAAFGLPQGQRKREAGPAPHLQAGGPGFPRPLPAAPHERSGGGPRGDTSKRPQPSSETGQTHRNGGTQAGRTEPVSLTAKRRAIKATGGAGALTRFFCVKPEGQATSSGSFHGCLRHGHECVGPQGAGGPYSTPFAQRDPWHSPSPSGVPHSGDNGTATLRTGPGHQGHRRRRRVLSPPHAHAQTAPRKPDSGGAAPPCPRCTAQAPLAPPRWACPRSRGTWAEAGAGGGALLRRLLAERGTRTSQTPPAASRGFGVTDTCRRLGSRWTRGLRRSSGAACCGGRRGPDAPIPGPRGPARRPHSPHLRAQQRDRPAGTGGGCGHCAGPPASIARTALA